MKEGRRLTKGHGYAGEISTNDRPSVSARTQGASAQQEAGWDSASPPPRWKQARCYSSFKRQSMKDPEACLYIRTCIMSVRQLLAKKVTDALREGRRLGMVSPGSEHFSRRRKVHLGRGIEQRTEERARRQPDLVSQAGTQYRHDLYIELHVVPDNAISAGGLGCEPVEDIDRIHPFQARPLQRNTVCGVCLGRLEVGVYLPSNTCPICSAHGRYVASMSSLTDTEGGSREITKRSNTSGDR